MSYYVNCDLLTAKKRKGDVKKETTTKDSKVQKRKRYVECPLDAGDAGVGDVAARRPGKRTAMPTWNVKENLNSGV